MLHLGGVSGERGALCRVTARRCDARCGGEVPACPDGDLPPPCTARGLVERVWIAPCSGLPGQALRVERDGAVPRTELGADPRPQPNPCSRMPCWVPPSLGGLHAAGSHLMPAGVPRSLRSPGTGEPVTGPPMPSPALRRPSPRRSATVSRADLRPTATAPCPEVFGAGVCESSDSP